MSSDTGTKFQISLLTIATPLWCSTLGSGLNLYVAEITVTVSNMIVNHAVKQNSKTYGICACTSTHDLCTQLIKSAYVVSNTC
jgi:hypothetical protein